MKFVVTLEASNFDLKVKYMHLARVLREASSLGGVVQAKNTHGRRALRISEEAVARGLETQDNLRQS